MYKLQSLSTDVALIVLFLYYTTYSTVTMQDNAVVIWCVHAVVKYYKLFIIKCVVLAT